MPDTVKASPEIGARLSLQVANQVRTMIMTGEIRGGDRLRTERLAEMIGVSPTPVREALMTLAGEGFVDFEPGKGFSAVYLTRTDLEDIYGAQAMISGELAARAASAASPELIAELQGLQEGLVRLVESNQFEEAQRVDFDWHHLINHIAPAKRLRWMLRATNQYVPFEAYGAIPGWSQAACVGHPPVMLAIGTGDAEGARAAMTAHIRHARSLVLDLLADRGLLADIEPAKRTR